MLELTNIYIYSQHLSEAKYSQHLSAQLARGTIFTASIGSVDSLYPSLYFWGCLSGAVGSVDVWCSARRCCRGRGFESRQRQNIYSIYRLS